LDTDFWFLFPTDFLAKGHKQAQMSTDWKFAFLSTSEKRYLILESHLT
jgi:hypothetical protein